MNCCIGVYLGVLIISKVESSITIDIFSSDSKMATDLKQHFGEFLLYNLFRLKL